MLFKFSLLLLASMLSTWDAPREKPPTVEQAARRYRIHVYDTYRTDRPEYNRRIAAAADLLARWTKQGEPAESAEQVVQWYEAARTADLDAVLPPLPSIHPVASLVDAEPPADALLLEDSAGIDLQPDASSPPRKEISISIEREERESTAPNFLTSPTLVAPENATLSEEPPAPPLP